MPDHQVRGPVTEAELVELVVEIATPIDFEGLIRRGILKRRSKLTYLVLDPKKLPPAVWRQAGGMSVTHGERSALTLTLRSNAKGAQRTLDKIARKPGGPDLMAAARARIAERAATGATTAPHSVLTPIRALRSERPKIAAKRRRKNS